MFDTIHDLLSAYRSTPETLQTLLRLSSLETINSSATGSGEAGWSVVEVVCHLRDSEEACLTRTRRMRDEIDPQLSARDGARLAIELNYAATPLDSALNDFLTFREEHIRELTALGPEQWERTGQHPAVGQITIRGLIEHLVAHDAIHLAQISRQLSR